MISVGAKTYKPRNQPIVTAIADISWNQYAISLFPGSRGINPQIDILIRYKGGTMRRMCSIKHIHWVVDLLIKNQSNQQLKQILINEISNWYNTAQPITNRNYTTLQAICTQIEQNILTTITPQCAALNQNNLMPVEVIYYITALFAVIEKTSSPHAHMFNDIVSLLQQQNINHYAVISKATHNGR